MMKEEMSLQYFIYRYIYAVFANFTLEAIQVLCNAFSRKSDTHHPQLR